MIHPWNRALWEQLPEFDRLPGVLLLCGPHGVGKRDFALALAKATLCCEPQAGRDACGTCRGCRLFDSSNHPDMRVLEPIAGEEEGDAAPQEQAASTGAGVTPARWIKVGAVRTLSGFLQLRAHFGGRKVVLVRPADRLHPAAANALLKTLEEPPTATHFLLVTDQAVRLPATVRSRCVRLTFGLPAAETACKWLRERGSEQPELALAQAGNAPLAALALDRTDYWAIRSTLIDEALAREQVDPVAIVDRLGTDQLPLVTGVLHRWCYDLATIQAGGRLRYNPDCAQILHRLATQVRRAPLLAFWRDLQSVTRWLEHPLNARLVAERCLIGYKNAITCTES